jgi:hypothetical protein
MVGSMAAAVALIAIILVGILFWPIHRESSSKPRIAPEAHPATVAEAGPKRSPTSQQKSGMEAQGMASEKTTTVTNGTDGPSKQNAPNRPQGMRSAILTIQSTPPFAEVQFDGYDLGRTPLEGKSCPIGPHTLTLKSRMGRELDTNINLQEGPQTLRFVLLENPEMTEHEEAER